MFDDQKGNQFNTYGSWATPQTAVKFIGTNTAYKMCVTDVMLYADTAGAFTFLKDTTTSQMVVNFANTGGSLMFNLNTPVVIPTNSALHITTAPSNASLFIAGFWK